MSLSPGRISEGAGWCMWALGTTAETLAGKLDGVLLAVAGLGLILGRFASLVWPSLLKIYKEWSIARREQRAADLELEIQSKHKEIEEQVAARLAELTSRLSAQDAELKAYREQVRCPFPRPDGKARCHGYTDPPDCLSGECPAVDPAKPQAEETEPGTSER